VRFVLAAAVVVLLAGCGISEDRAPRRIDASPVHIGVVGDEVGTGILES
jgi:ABC-type phosphate/phosphonate transport system substrate-binding protein